MLGHADLIRVLAKFGAEVDARSMSGRTPLKTAAGNDNLACVQTLLELGADVRLGLTDNKQNVLHNIRSVEIAKTLLEAGAELDGVDENGETPLHFAVFNGFVDLAVFLIQNGADTDAKSDEGKTPIDIARTSLEQPDLSRVLDAVNKRETQNRGAE